MEELLQVWNEMLQWCITNQRTLTIVSVLGLLVTNFMAFLFWFDEKRYRKRDNLDARKVSAELHEVKTTYVKNSKVASEVARLFGKFEEGQTWLQRLTKIVYYNKQEVKNLQTMNDNQSHTLSERETEIKRLTGIAEKHYQDFEDMRKQRDSALEEAQDIDSEFNNFKNRDQPDYVGLEEKYNRQEIMVRKITSGRDNALNDLARCQAYADNLESSMLKSKKTYTSKLDKLRKAIRGEGWGYELNGRKIVLFETEE